MKKIFSFALAAAIMAGATSCGHDSADPEGGNNPYKPLELSTKSSEFVQKGQRFSFDFIERVNASTDKDYIVSPLSMQFLLGMILDGARGETAAEICSVLGYGAGEKEAVDQYCLSMMQQLPSMDRKTRLSIANAIFVDEGWPLKDAYKDNVGRYHLAEVDNLDFSDGPASLKAINGWCSKHTYGLIPKILDEVDPNMLAYLLNAVYFKSRWAEPFRKEASAQEDFTDESGTERKVTMMKRNLTCLYAENDVFSAVRLPYGNGAFSMTVLLPQKGYKVSDVAAALRQLDWDDFRREEMFHCEADLWLPRFETEFHVNLNDILSEMGMPLAFDRLKADFLDMSEFALCLSFVKQDAVIKVDEEGTEAAAVSSAGIEKATSAGPGSHVVFHADHPFLYLVSESSTGAILFAGRYAAK